MMYIIYILHYNVRKVPSSLILKFGYQWGVIMEFTGYLVRPTPPLIGLHLSFVVLEAK